MFESDIIGNNCCEQMDFHIKEKERIIRYIKRTRIYAIHVRGEHTIQQIYFCPWCGSKLPNDLSQEWEKEVCKKLNVSVDELCDIENKDLPEEFQTDEWWKKRGM